MTTAKSLFHRVLSRAKKTLANHGGLSQRNARHSNPYATLLPMLAAIASARRIERVVEFGCGRNSTPAFLNRRVFPSLSSLISVENNAEWSQLIRAETRDDRLTMVDIDGSIACSVANNNVVSAAVKAADLILVDDSTCAADRAATLTEVCHALSTSAVLVVHDFEVPEYREASRQLPVQFVSDALLPNTGILAWTELLSVRWCGRINRLIRKHSSTVPLTDIETWSCIFSRSRR